MSDSELSGFTTSVRDAPDNFRNRGNSRRFSSAMSRVMVSSGATRNSKLDPDAPLSSHVFYLILRIFLQCSYFIFSGFQWILYHYHRSRLRLSSVAVYHNRTPQLIRNDVTNLDKIPRHVAAVLDLKPESIEGGGIDGLLHQTGEIAAWCVGAGISVLTVYERRGILKSLPIHDVNRAIAHNLENYFGVSNRPKFRIVVPKPSTNQQPQSNNHKVDLTINLISLSDGRNDIVELSKTLADMATKHELSHNDLNVELINFHLNDTLSEPDLVILFTPIIDLQGFPPWQIRLSEIFYLPDNDEVSYVVFLKALQKYANCKINIGK